MNYSYFSGTGTVVKTVRRCIVYNLERYGLTRTSLKGKGRVRMMYKIRLLREEYSRLFDECPLREDVKNLDFLQQFFINLLCILL
jgi:hypothetical protein